MDAENDGDENLLYYHTERRKKVSFHHLHSPPFLNISISCASSVSEILYTKSAGAEFSTFYGFSALPPI